VAILDLTIASGMGGKDVMPKIRALFPDISSVVASGYSDDDVMAQHAHHGFDAVLEKPFTREEFVLAVKTARDQRR
jgi:two-component system, cell cycle sensor histidine kinase and response regulator CckA